MTAARRGLEVRGLRAGIGGVEIINGIDLTVRPGEVHVIMGPNGSGKSTLSHVLAGRPGYEVLGGSIHLDGHDLVGLPAWRRAQLGMFLAMQYPTEVPGVSLTDVLAAAGASGPSLEPTLRSEADRVGLDPELLDRPLNVDLSGGEKKRTETVQLAVLDRSLAILDEVDSGLDVDGMRLVSRRVAELVTERNLGVLAITHFARLLDELPADHIHVLVSGRFVAEGGPELAAELEASGYGRWVTDTSHRAGEAAVGVGARELDPFADPFADPLV